MEAEIEVSRKVIRRALRESRKPLVCWSGGKDSTLMTYLVSKEARKLRKEVWYLVGDPIPIEGNHDWISLTAAKLGIKNLIWYPDIIPKGAWKFSILKGNDRVTCCRMLKVVPLLNLIKEEGFDYVFVSVRWDEHPARAGERVFRRIRSPKHIRVHPILWLRWSEILEWYLRHPGLFNPLYLKGYTSLGCAPCTEPTLGRTFDSVEEYVRYVEEAGVKERAGRAQDKEMVMEKLRRWGYF